MKYSKYNILVRSLTKTDIVYNSLSDKFIFLRKGRWENCIINDNSQCYEMLRQGGFIVDDNVDEIQMYIEKARKIENDETCKHLIINPTINCNFNCWYCYEKHIPSEMTADTINNIKKLIEKSCKQSKELMISFFGGEPFLCYKRVMLPILTYAKKIAQENNVRFVSNCTTNGSLINIERIKELKSLNFNFAQITLDGNREVHNQTRRFANGKGTYDIILQNIKELARNQIHVTIRINYTKNNASSIVDVPTDFIDLTCDEKKYIDVSFHKVWQENEFESDDVFESISAFKKNGFVASRFLLGPFCYGDLRNSAIINYNGDIYKCTAVNFIDTPRDGYLNSEGDIIWENDSLEKRMAAKFTNKPCIECKIMPICHGGCSSKPLEKGDNYCIFDFDDSRKMDAVMEKLLYNIHYKWKDILSVF